MQAGYPPSPDSSLFPLHITTIKTWTQSVNLNISVRSHLLLCLPISKMPHIFPARWCLNFSHSAGWVIMVSKIHPFQEVGLDWLLDTFSMSAPTIMVSKIHPFQEVRLNCFSNVPTPLFHSFGAATRVLQCSGWVTEQVATWLHKGLIFYKDRVVAHQEYFASAEKLQLWENHPVVTVVCPRHS